MDLLVGLLKIGGVSALSIGVLFLIYRQLLSLNIFPRLTRRQAFILLITVVILTFIVVGLAFISTGALTISGNVNRINSGGSSTNTIIDGN